MGEEVAIVDNLAATDVDFVLMAKYFLCFFIILRIFCFLTIFIYNKRKGNALSADSVRALVNVPVERITTFHEAPSFMYG